MSNFNYNNILRKVIILLKRLRNRVFHMEEPKVTPIVYNIERFSYENNILNVEGWVFLKNKKIKNVDVILNHREQEYRACTLRNLKKRLDVYNVYKNKNSINSGFQTKIRIENASKVLIYLEIDNKERILINKINESFFDKLKIYKKKLTVQNIKKAMILLRKREIAKLAKSVEKIEIEVIDNKPEIIDYNEFTDKEIVNELKYHVALYNYTIDIIIPIYNGYEYLQNLFDTITRTEMSFRIIAINDCSTDDRVREFLNQYKKSNDIILIENNKNLGFVKSVNRAFCEVKNNIALLNTDIELPKMWLERLIAPIILNKNVASSTPFTNCGTVCSFPDFFKDNNIFENLDLDTIDNAFKLVKPNYIDIPTGVGFCMGINKKALDEIGHFDADTFAKGYGEENDWCQRAYKAGYRNVQVENLYIYHKHGGSFINEERKKLIKLNSILLERKHPNFNVDVVDFCNADPAKNIRTYVIFKLLSSTSDNINVYFNHNIGGGATTYLQKEIDKSTSNGNSNIIVSYDVVKNKYIFNYKYKNYNILYYFRKFQDIINVLYKLNLESIYINELVTYPNIYDILEKLYKLKKEKHINLIMLLHDFYSVCPTINLLDYKGYYCNVPSIEECEKCIKKNELNTYYNYENMTEWRENWGEFLSNCDKIITFSESSKIILLNCYCSLSNITVKPHVVDYILPLKKEYKFTNKLNIGLLGTLNYNKGSEIVKKMLDIIKNFDLGIDIILIGSAVEKIKHENFKETGEYTVDMINKLVIENDIDLFFISSIWPETFSYTTQEIINMELPVVSFDLGAQAEKIKSYNKGLILRSFNEKDALHEIINFSKQVVDLQNNNKL